MRSAAILATAAAVLMSANQAFAFPRISQVTIEEPTQKVHYTGRRHSHLFGHRSRNRTRLEDGGLNRDLRGRLPQRHIDWCNKQNMGYREYDNTLAFDRHFRIQCRSPYF